MGRKKKYRNASEKQRAWRIRTGKQKRKVPITMRVGEQTGTSEGQLRERHEGETWEEYHKYIVSRLEKSQTGSREGRSIDKDLSGVSARRGGVEPVYPGDYYEMREKRVASYQEGKIKEKRRKRKV